MAPTPDVNVDDLRRRARRRLVGAIVLALSAAVFVPMLLESEPKPLGEDVSVRIPPIDNGKFVNKLNAKAGTEAARNSPGKAEAPRPEPPKTDTAKQDQAKMDAARTDAAKADTAKAEAALADTSVVPASGAPAMPSSNLPPPVTTAANTIAPPKRSLAEAEQKVLSAPAKTPTAVTPPVAVGAATKAAAPSPALVPVTAPPKAEPAKVEPAKTESARPESANTVADGPGFSVQLAAFTDDKGANSLANRLKLAGYPTYTEPLNTAGKSTQWRVRVGPFPTRESAGTARDKLKGDGYSGIVVPAR